MGITARCIGRHKSQVGTWDSPDLLLQTETAGASSVSHEIENFPVKTWKLWASVL